MGTQNEKQKGRNREPAREQAVERPELLAQQVVEPFDGQTPVIACDPISEQCALLDGMLGKGIARLVNGERQGARPCVRVDDVVFVPAAGEHVLVGLVSGGASG